MPGKFHYAWVVAGMTFITLLVVAGVRSAPGVIILPLQAETGWSVAMISGAIAINIALYGIMGPFAAAIMQRFGLRRSMLVALGIMAIATAASALIITPIGLYLTWGLGVGLGVGSTGMVLATVVATRWFVAKRGLMVGLMTGATSTGQLIFLPTLAFVADRFGWRPVGFVVCGAALLVAIPVALFMRDHPEDVGEVALGAPPAVPGAPGPRDDRANPMGTAFRVLRESLRNRDFIIIAATFFVCGASTAGFIGTHWIAMCGDHGIPQVKAAGLLAFMGIFSLIGTTGAGWLSDKIRPAPLLFLMYGTRGLALFALPSLLDASWAFALPLFMVFFGLDWLATIGPNVRALTEALGRANAPIAMGWCGVSHQVGAASIAFFAGSVRTGTQSYTLAFAFAGTVCILGALTSLAIGRNRKPDRPVDPSTPLRYAQGRLA
jgi:predicted MFS family arabinose efflux permease